MFRIHSTISQLSIVLLLLAFGSSCRRTPSPPASASPQKTRAAVFAGDWYPDNPPELRRFIEQQLADAEIPKLSGPVVGLIAPHAGYQFSGAVLGAAYRAVRGDEVSVVVLLGSPHRVPVAGAAVPESEAFRTPLGVVRVATELCKELISHCDFVEKSDVPHAREHSLELQVPFLQVALAPVKEFRILPLLVGELTRDQSEELAHALATILAGKRALIVASTDLSHYPSYEDAKKADEAILAATVALDASALEKKNDELLHSRIPRLDCTMCGLNAVLVLERVAKFMQVTEAKILCYRNSGDTFIGGKDRVVGYGAVAFLTSPASGGKWPRPEKLRKADARSKSEEASVIGPQGQKRLLEIARRCVEAAARKEPEPEFSVDEPELVRKAGAFVTLKKHGELRGCIGIIEPIRPLWKTVAYAARQAAVADSRFNPVAPEELRDIHLEISVLSPVVPVKQLEEIKVGRDGLIVRQGFASGLLLPQVATEQKWGRDEFLAQTCRKAGLPADAYKKGASVYRFTAQMFGEE